MNPLISIVIPSYNHGRYLPRTLQSLLDQKYTKWEAIVVDNHSIDDTDQVLGRFLDPRIKVLKIHNNAIIAASRNKGISASVGEWVAFLDSDDWWTPDKLMVCVQHMGAETNLIYHDLLISRSAPGRFQRRKNRTRKLKKPVLLDLLINGNAISNSSVLVRKEVLRQIGGLDENPQLVAAEDYHMWLRIAQISDGFYYIPESLGYYTEHNGGMSQRDMSVPTRRAVSGYIEELNSWQRTAVESGLRYISGRHHWLFGSRHVANQDLLFCARHGDFWLRLKSIFMIIHGQFRKVPKPSC